MVKIIARNENYYGISASVKFEKGVGYTSDPRLIQWFSENGYTVVKEKSEQQEIKLIFEEEKKADEKAEEVKEVEPEKLKSVPKPTPKPATKISQKAKTPVRKPQPVRKPGTSTTGKK